MRDPQVFLFDEPLSNLDAKLRVQMRTEIKELHQRLTTTSIYVTHDQIEAMTMADKIVVMNAGRTEQIGTPLELYDNPANLFVAGFIGSPSMNFVHCTLQEQGGKVSTVIDNAGVKTEVTLPFSLATLRAQIGRKVRAGEECAVVESVKAASDIYAPIAGEVVAVNQAAADAPESVNQDAYAAWLFKLKPDNAADLDGLLDAAAYAKVAAED